MDTDASERKIRVLVAKPGVVGHRIGAELLCQSFRDAGMEVIYTGPYQMPEMIVNTAVQEDVDIIALSSLSWSSTADFTDVMAVIKARDLNIPVVGGGLIPEEDKAFLESIGVRGNYGPGTPLQKIIDLVARTVKGRK
jgi:methylmalonyl-CoA mutase C-terminal domain/subunit